MGKGVVIGGLNGGGSNIKSIQRGTTTVNATTVNVGISPVDLTKSVLILSICGKSNSTADKIIVSGEITTAGNIAFYVNTAALNYSIVEWTVIEFNNVKSLQKGTKSTSLTSDTIAISSINPLKSLLFASFTTADIGTVMASSFPSFALNNATTIAIAQNTGNTINIKWQAIEFN